jgi:UDP-N-acetylglucosamine 2-epimerase
MRLTYIVGTRPNFVKMAPVIARMPSPMLDSLTLPASVCRTPSLRVWPFLRQALHRMYPIRLAPVLEAAAS